MVLWQSPDTPVMSGFHVSRLRVLFHVREWCSDPGTYVLTWFCVGVQTLALCFLSLCGSVRSLVRSAPRTLVHVCFVVLHAVRVFIGCVHSCYILCCVAHSLCISLAACFHVVMSCVITWLMSFLISCMFVSCFAHGWWFVCWPCACVFVLCEHMAFVLVFCVPCALMSICLDPTHLVTCLLVNFPQLLSLVTLLICSLYNLLVLAVLGWVGVVWCMPCVLPCLPVCFSPTGLFLFVLFIIIINKKPVYLLQLGPRSLPITQPDSALCMCVYQCLKLN